MHRKSAYILSLAVLGVLVIGIVMLFSTSAYARDSGGNDYAFLKRQSIYLVVGFVVCVLATIVDYHFWGRSWWCWFGLALVTPTHCDIPPIGLRVNGSWRWLNIAVCGFHRLRMAELASG